MTQASPSEAPAAVAAPPQVPTPAPIWRRWWQPRNPLFWMLVMLNLLNAVIGVMMRLPDQPTVVVVVLGVFGLSNALLSLWLLARLLKPAAMPPAKPT